MLMEKKLYYIVLLLLYNITRLDNSRGADVAKWIKAVDCESTMRGFNSRRSPKFLFFLINYSLQKDFFLVNVSQLPPIFFL
jgi:hypothetical protein